MSTHLGHVFFDDPSPEDFVGPGLAASLYACGLLVGPNVRESGR